MSATPPIESNLPRLLTPFIGRARELAEIVALLAETRLLTLTGAGGSGKTRLAIEVARHCLGEDRGSLRWVELAPLVSGDLIAEHVAAQLHVQQRPDQTTVDALVDSLQAIRWLVLDNCEHVVEAAAVLIETLLQRCERLTVLATSREALGIDGERAWLLRGFATELLEGGTAADGSDAVRFFIDRARAVKKSFGVSERNAAAVEHICRRLDGMPLALELAAARIAVLTPEQIAARLDDAFHLLTAGKRTALPRHRTLAAAVEWSYRLISPAEQELLRRLSVFAGPFSLEAAEHVCAGDGLAASDVLELLATLVNRSLVNVHDAPDAARYSLLEIIRQFASEQRASRGGTPVLAARHADFYASLAETAQRHLEDSRSQIWIDRLRADYADIRAALKWAYRGGDTRVGHRLFGALLWYWGLEWQLSEWRYWLDEALRDRNPEESQSWGQVLNSAGTLVYLLGDVTKGRSMLERAAGVLARAGDRVHESMARSTLCHLLWNDDQLDAAREQGELAASIARTVDDVWPLCHAMSNALGPVQIELGALEAADACFQEAWEKATQHGHAWGAASVARSRAALALDRKRIDEAVHYMLAAVHGIRSIRDPHTARRIVLVLGRVLAASGEHEGAARLTGTMAATLDNGMPLLRHEADDFARLIETVRSALGAERFEALHAQGRTETVDDTLARGYETLSRLGTSAAGGTTSRSMRSLRARVLGPIEITLNGAPRLSGSRQSKVLELLVYLLCHPEGRTREQVGVAFWPDASATQVKNNFHVLLHKLRKSLADDDIVVVQGERYRIDPSLSVWFDALEFERTLSVGPRMLARGTEPAILDAGLALYRGEFMAGEPLGEWGLEARERLHRAYLDGLSALADSQIAAGDPHRAAATLERLVHADDLREEAYRRLMKCLEAAGLREQALRHYDRLVTRLRAELDVVPERETRILAERIQKASAR